MSGWEHSRHFDRLPRDTSGLPEEVGAITAGRQAAMDAFSPPWLCPSLGRPMATAVSGGDLPP